MQALTGIRVEGVPRSRAKAVGGMIRHVYYLRFKDLDPSLEPLVGAFTRHVARILDEWISEASVEVRMETVEETNP